MEYAKGRPNDKYFFDLLFSLHNVKISNTNVVYSVTVSIYFCLSVYKINSNKCLQQVSRINHVYEIFMYNNCKQYVRSKSIRAIIPLIELIIDYFIPKLKSIMQFDSTICVCVV